MPASTVHTTSSFSNLMLFDRASLVSMVKKKAN